MGFQFDEGMNAPISYENGAINLRMQKLAGLWLRHFKSSGDIPSREDFNLQSLRSDASYFRVSSLLNDEIILHLVGTKVAEAYKNNFPEQNVTDVFVESIVRLYKQMITYTNQHQCGLLAESEFVFPSGEAEQIISLSLPIQPIEARCQSTVSEMFVTGKNWVHRDERDISKKLNC